MVREDCNRLYREYGNIIGKLVNMAIKPDNWSL